MKKLIKRALVVLVVVATVFSLVACKTKEANTGILPEDYQVNVEGNIVFTYSGGSISPEAKMAADTFISAFNKKYPKASVTPDYSNSSIDTRISSGDIGDVFYFAEEGLYNYAITHKAVMPLDYYVEKLNINVGDVFSGIYNLGTINGKLYFVSRDYNHITMIYNKSALTAKGVTEKVYPDWTWHEFLSLCEEVTDEDYYGASLDLSYDPVFIPFFEAYAGRDTWCDIEQRKVTFIDSEGLVLKAFGEAIDAAMKGYLSLGGADINSYSSEPIFKTLVYPGIGGAGQAYDTKAIDWDLINLPLFDVPSFGCGSSGYSVYNRTSNPDTAAAFTLFFFDEEGQKAFNGTKGGSVPLLASLKDFDGWRYTNDENWKDKNWDAFVYKAEKYSTVGQLECRMPISVADLIEQKVPQIIKKHMQGSQDYTDGFAALEEQANQAWSQLIE